MMDDKDDLMKDEDALDPFADGKAPVPVVVDDEDLVDSPDTVSLDDAIEEEEEEEDGFDDVEADDR
jgi:hypothetical protein